MGLVIRDAVREDAPLILHFIEALAEYEKLSHEAVASEALRAASPAWPAPRRGSRA